MTSKALSVSEYLENLPEDRREAISVVRNEILRNLPDGFEEGIQYGMIGYFVPHSIYPDGYHCDPKQPVPFASIASQKNHMAVYMFCIYTDPAVADWFVEEYKKSGKKLDMGKGCVRFKKLEDLPVELIGQAIAKVTLDDFLANYIANIPESKRKKK
ncbi:DUF1801 domain-containing protein [Kamptonema cortianum]|nr:DUF1801 domain-containing protein [Geitlerinema splendidum]MDK3158454.1 DUF1801 domain-containing protein [Kamptonema cortianum]